MLRAIRRERRRRAAIMRGLYRLFMGATGAAFLATVFFAAGVDGPGWALGLTGFSVSAIATAGFYKIAEWAEEGIA
jgi:cyanate permease